MHRGTLTVPSTFSVVFARGEIIADQLEDPEEDASTDSPAPEEPTNEGD